MSRNSDERVIEGDVECDGRVVFYIIKADQTSYINYIKPLILAQELAIHHIISVIDTRSEWYYKVHPERYVPALKDYDPLVGKDVFVFESTGCLQYLASKFDKEGFWTGRNDWEKAQVFSWTAYQTAGLGPTAKYWLYFSKGFPSRQAPILLPRTVAKLHANVLDHWDRLERRLSEKDQMYVAVPDRPTLADLSYLPFAMPWMFSFPGTDIRAYPRVKEWGEVMMRREAVMHVLDRGPIYGHQMG